MSVIVLLQLLSTDGFAYDNGSTGVTATVTTGRAPRAASQGSDSPVACDFSARFVFYSRRVCYRASSTPVNGGVTGAGLMGEFGREIWRRNW